MVLHSSVPVQHFVGRTYFAFDQREGHTLADLLVVEDIHSGGLGERLLGAWHRDDRFVGHQRLVDSLEVQRMGALSLGSCSVDMPDLKLLQKKVPIRK